MLAAAASYAVIWRYQTDEVYTGKLELSCDRLRLSGACHGDPACVEIPYQELRAVRRPRETGVAVRELPALLLELANGGVLVLASLFGVGALSEVAATVAWVANIG
jgi:hypothetical protein